MIAIIQEFIEGIRNLFPNSKDLKIVSGLVVLATVVSVSELLLARFFSLLILPDNSRSSSSLIFLSSLFLVSFGALRVVNYGREYYRLNVFEKALAEGEGRNKYANSWRWATAMELTALLTLCGRWIFIALVLFWFSPIFGLSSFFLGLLIFKAFSTQMRKQYVKQRNFIALRDKKVNVSNAEKVRTRILAGEFGALVSAFGLLILFGLLIFFNTEEEIDPAMAFTLFIAVRMLGQIYSGFSSGLMRYVRARVYSE